MSRRGRVAEGRESVLIRRSAGVTVRWLEQPDPTSLLPKVTQHPVPPGDPGCVRMDIQSSSLGEQVARRRRGRDPKEFRVLLSFGLREAQRMLDRSGASAGEPGKPRSDEP